MFWPALLLVFSLSMPTRSGPLVFRGAILVSLLAVLTVFAVRVWILRSGPSLVPTAMGAGAIAVMALDHSVVAFEPLTLFMAIAALAIAGWLAELASDGVVRLSGWLFGPQH
jgi:hypothetical protein